MHDGLDIAAPLGSPIHAVGEGTVLYAGPQPGYGMTIKIQHPTGDVSFYGHMSTVNVAAGDKVRAGQVIAPVGNEGFSTGPHVHFTVRVGGRAGPTVDPEAWLADRGVSDPGGARA